MAAHDPAQSSPGGSQLSSDRTMRGPFGWIVLFLLLVLVRIPYYATHHIQEDAYITFRAAFHLADLGQFSYNLGTHTPGVTSMVYGLIVALIRLIFRSHAILAVQVFGTLVQVLGSLLLAKTLFTDEARQKTLFVLVGCLPMSLQISYAGMEIPLLVVVVCWALYTVRTGRASWWCLLPVYLLPLVRPDAVSYALLLACLIFTMDRIKGLAAVVATGAGTLTVLLFNKVVTGAFITNTMRAKEIIYSPDRSAHAILYRMGLTYIHQSFGGLIWTPVFQRFGIVAIVLAVVVCVVTVRKRPGAPVSRLLLFCLATALIIPFCYDVGGILFPWYVWTPSWLIISICCYALTDYLYSPGAKLRGPAVVLTCLGMLAICVGQWIYSYSKGAEEYGYRASIGLGIKQIAQPGDTIFLEPAGYIPFFSGLYADDVVGLGSQRMLDYRIKYGNYYLYRFIKDYKPTFLLVIPGEPDIKESDAIQHAWIASHYHVVQRYHYDPANFIHSPLLMRFVEGTHVFDYDVWQTNDRP